jgi:hypothetical protein
MATNPMDTNPRKTRNSAPPREPKPLWLDTCQIVRSLLSYGRYQRDPERAARLLHDKHPELSIEACLERIHAYSRVHEHGFELFKSYLRVEPMGRQVSFEDVDLDTFTRDLAAAHPSVEEDAIRFFASWTVFWGYAK